MTQTKLTDLFNPQVVADAITMKLPSSLAFAPLVSLDRTLQGQPGNTITLVKYGYIGEAAEISEGQPIPAEAMATTNSQATIKKLAKSIEVTDEAALSAVGDPAGRAVTQITAAIADAIDSAVLKEALTAPQNVTTKPQTVAAIDEAMELLDDKAGVYVLVVNRKDATKIKKDAGTSFLQGTEAGAQVGLTGVFGEVSGALIVRSQKLKEGTAVLVKLNENPNFTDKYSVNSEFDITDQENRYISPIATYIKADTNVETKRNPGVSTEIVGTQHAAVKLVDDTKVVVIGSKTNFPS